MSIYDLPPVLPPSPFDVQEAPEPSFDEFVAALGPNFGAQQEAPPSDFFARLAQQSGPQPFSFRARQKPTGLEALLAFAAGFGNARAAGGARRVMQTEDRNQQAREAAKTLATWRHGERMAKERARLNRENILATQAAKPPPDPEALENVIDPKTGKPVKVLRSKAAGMEPAYPPTEGADQSRLNNAINAITDDVRQNPSIQGYSNLASYLRTAKAGQAQGGGFGDVAMVFSFMRAMEPENPNVVREGEYANARQAVGALQKYGSLFKRFIQGDQFLPEGRQKIVNMIAAAARAKRPAYESARRQVEKRAKFSQVPGELVLPDVPSVDELLKESQGSGTQPTKSDIDYVRSLGIGR